MSAGKGTPSKNQPGNAQRLLALRDAVSTSTGLFLLKAVIIVLIVIVLRSWLLDIAQDRAESFAARAAKSIDPIAFQTLAGNSAGSEASKEMLVTHLRTAFEGESDVVRIRTFSLADDASRQLLDTTGAPPPSRVPSLGSTTTDRLREGLHFIEQTGHDWVLGPKIITGYAPVYAQPGKITGAVAVDMNPIPLRQRLRALTVSTASLLILSLGVSVLLGWRGWKRRLAAAQTQLSLERARQIEKFTIEALGEILYTRHIGRNAFEWRGNPAPILGIDLENLPADVSGWISLIHPEDRDRYRREIEAAASDDRLSIEYRVRHAGGQFIWILDRATLGTIDAAEQAFVGAMLDITIRKDSDQALRSFIEQTPTAHLVFEGDQVLDANPAAVRMFSEADLATLLDTPMWKFWPKRQAGGQLSAEAWSTHVLATLEDRVCHFEWGFIRADGRDLFADVFLNCVTLGDREVLMMACYDLTEARQAQGKLIESEQRFRDVSEAVGEFIWEVDAENRYTYVSHRVNDVLGLEPEEIIGKRPFDWLPEEDREDVQARSEAILASTSGFRNFEHRIRRKDGRIIWISVSGQPRYDSGGQISGYRGASLDITQRRNYEIELVRQKEAAEAADQAKSSFLAMMSHEIRTPLNSVLGFTDLVMQTHLDKTQREYLETIRSSSDALLSLLNDILDFSKIESGRLEVAPHPTDLRRCIREALDLYRVSAAERGNSLAIEISSRVPDLVMIDPSRLRQILVNLIGNAVKFTEKGRIEIHCALKEGEAAGHPMLRFTVADTGIGIRPEQRERLFKPFSQADSSTNRRFGGTGLGLAISRRLALLLNGNLGILETSDAGSTFFLDIPAILPTEAEIDEARTGEPDVELLSAAAPMLPEGSRPKVLVVDDNSLNRRLTVQILTQLGAEASSSPGAEECIARIASESFGLILMDVQMPGIDGLEAARMIRKLEQEKGLQRVRIIALTAEAMAGDRERCLAAGMDDYLSKPVRRAALAAALRSSFPPDAA